MYRQGDVLIVPMAETSVPPGTDRLPRQPRDARGRLVLALGEVTGHAHAVVREPGPFGVSYLHLPDGGRGSGTMTTPMETAQVDTMVLWREVVAATGPADRAAAEVGVRLAYRLAGLPEPERIVWAGSPREGAASAARLTAEGTAGRSVRDAVRTRPWAAARERVHDRLGPTGWAERWALTGAQLWDTTVMLTERIRAGIVEALAGVPGGEQAVRLVLLDAVLGQHDAAWLAAFDGQDGGEALDGIAAVARAAGWWWPYEKTAVVAERPVELHRDEAGRLDRGDGPALAFPDGFALHAWRGMPVPAEFLSGLARLTPRRIREEENAELRRVMLEHYGYDRYLEESGAEPMQRDEAGVLWRIELEGDEPLVMVEVVNSTPEPDGTHRTYWLRVPPRTRTAREGVAWTFGLEEADYAPERET
jgi:hypothetical protein